MWGINLRTLIVLLAIAVAVAYCASIVLLLTIGGHVSEFFGTWDHTLQTGREANYTVVVIAAVVGSAFLAVCTVRALRRRPARVSGAKPPVRIAVDMDEVIADYFGEQVARYESWSGTAVDISAIEGKRLRECVPPEHREFISRLPGTPGFFANLKMIEGSRDALQILSQHSRIYIVSAATEYPNSLREKFDWLAANFPFIDWRQIVLCGDKSIIRAEYMIDDNIYHLRRFEGEKILFDSPHNRKVPDVVHRVRNWDEVLSFFRTQGVLPSN
jgi:5'(3')-deoxyribonucleotidase